MNMRSVLNLLDLRYTVAHLERIIKHTVKYMVLGFKNMVWRCGFQKSSAQAKSTDVEMRGLSPKNMVA